MPRRQQEQTQDPSAVSDDDYEYDEGDEELLVEDDVEEDLQQQK